MIFIHIPKCGGSAFRDAIQRSCGPHSWLNVWPSLAATSLHPMAMPLVIGGHIPYGYFSGAMGEQKHAVLLRDPVERINSYYHFAKRTANRLTYAASNLCIWDFCNRTEEPDLDDGMVRQLAGVSPYADYVTDEHLELAKANLDKCIAGDTKHMAEFIAKVANHLKVAIKPAARVNVTREKGKLDRHAREVIEESQTYDVALWEYYKAKGVNIE